MSIHFERKKSRHWLLSMAYRVHRFLPMSSKRKLALYLDVEWIANRLANETSHKLYEFDRHPVRQIPFLFDAIVPGERVLDLGCSSGTIAGLIAARNADVVGIDLDLDALEVARRRYPQIDFRHGDVWEYLKEAGSFDVIILSHILEHLDDPEAFLRKATPHAKRIYIEVPDLESTSLNVFREATGAQLVYQDNDHVTEFDRDDLRQMIRAVDLTIVAEEYRFGVMRFWCATKS